MIDDDKAATAGVTKPVPEPKNAEFGGVKAAEESAPRSMPDKGGRLSPGFIGGGVLAAVVVLSYVSYVSFASATKEPSKELIKIEELYQKNIAQIVPAADFLSNVKAEIVRWQKTRASRLTKIAGKKFVPLKDINDKLASQMPESLPPGSAVVVRANATDYKILFNWPLCATVQVARPDLVDPMRSVDGLGCAAFGLWTGKAANW